MAKILQFRIMLVYTVDEVDSDGKRAEVTRLTEVDLIGGDLSAFLSSLPPYINEKSTVMIAIVDDQGNAIGYADGLIPDHDASVHFGWKRLSEAPGNRDDACRNQALLFAKRRAEDTETHPEQSDAIDSGVNG
jgi:hypothetical protein